MILSPPRQPDARSRSLHLIADNIMGRFASTASPFIATRWCLLWYFTRFHDYSSSQHRRQSHNFVVTVLFRFDDMTFTSSFLYRHAIFLIINRLYRISFFYQNTTFASALILVGKPPPSRVSSINIITHARRIALLDDFTRILSFRYR